MSEDTNHQNIKVGDVVQHIFLGRYATVEKVGRKLLLVNVHLADRKVRWNITSVRRIDN